MCVYCEVLNLGWWVAKSKISILSFLIFGVLFFSFIFFYCDLCCYLKDILHLAAMLSLAFLLCFTILSATSCCGEHDVYTAFGRRVPAALVREHIPRVSDDEELRHALFEHRAEDGLLVSLSGEVDIDDVAPQVHVEDMSSTRVVVDGVQRQAKGPVMRFGDGYTFVFDHQSGLMLAAWGPRLHLRPLHLELHPNVLVNLRHQSASSNASLHLLPVPSPRDHLVESHQESKDDSGEDRPSLFPSSSSSSMSLPSPLHDVAVARSAGYRPAFTSESHIYFDVSFAFDASFCARYSLSEDNATQAVHAAGVAAHKMALGPIVSVRIGDIIGSCLPANDTFRKPPNLFNCPLTSQRCSRPGMILKSFRNAWPGGGIADATYLLTGYDEGSDIVGAAWVAAACNPKFAFGWIEGDHPVIIAHEIAHTLGAPHDKDGLMSPTLDLDTPTNLSSKSLNAIQTFIRKIAPQNCLTPRTGSTSQGRRRYSAFIQLTRERVVEGTDVEIVAMANNRVATLVLLDVRRTRKPIDYLVFSFSNVLRIPNNRYFPFFVQRETGAKSFIVKRSFGTLPAGGGITIAKVLDGVYDDILAVFMRDASYARYVIGGQLDPAVGVRGTWLSPRVVPRRLGNNIQCLGATSGDIRGNGSIDLVIAYVDFRNDEYVPFYIIGFGMDSTGKASRGWSPPIPIPWKTSLAIGDISAALYDTTRTGRPDLIVSHTEQINGLWAHRITVGYNLNKWGRSNKPWKSVTPDLTYTPTSEIEKITGGIALGNIASKRPTAVLYQGRQISDGNTQWVEIGDDILSEEPGDTTPFIAQVDGTTPLETCEECYPDVKESARCQRRIRKCFARRPPPVLSSLYTRALSLPPTQSLSTAAQQTSEIAWMSVAMFKLKPGNPTIFCSGFFQLYLASEKGCRSDLQPVDIVSAGVTAALQDDVDSIEMNSTITAVRYNTTFGNVPEHLRYLAPGGTSGSARVPKSVKVYFRSGKATRAEIIRKAVAKFRKRSDFTGFFAKATFRIRRKGRYQYVVFVKFNDRYVKEFLKELPTES